MRFTNAVLQLLVHTSPFWYLFRELGDLKEQCGAGGPETGDDATPLVNATVRFVEEFVSKEELPPKQKPQEVRGGKLKEGEEAKKDDSAAADSLEPMYMYDVMKKKRQLTTLLVRCRAMLRPAITDLCWRI